MVSPTGRYVRRTRAGEITGEHEAEVIGTRAAADRREVDVDRRVCRKDRPRGGGK